MSLGEYNPYLSFDGSIEDESAFRMRTGAPGPVGAQGARGAQGAQGPSGKSATGQSGALLVSSTTDVLAEPSSIYYSTNQQKLIFKDTQGRLFAITGETPVGRAAVTKDGIGPQT